jgi:acyl transferase domain-containing protein/NADPH:quinone reductase-like Zn-dependent oxidoreductase/NAD(P)-dependent dehydrogenase (short-subunit alcohol dehydrogenase family)
MAADIHQLRDDIAVVGWSCRLPGANSIDGLWSLLIDGRCAVTRMPADRFSLERYGHPRKTERGKSYTWAAGVLDDIWGFDPAVFGISPREAVQIDPQQRILLQLTWEAMEDAGIRPSSIANTDVGVFIGASQADYGHAFFDDPAIADAHFSTGTAVSILANRISYIFGLNGPSLAIDTACSSSLVALNQAVEALRSGRIETAIVGGSNLLTGPSSFVAFSQANMLSQKGLCQAFAAGADGFVRAEGAVVLVLRKTAHAQSQRNPIHGLLLATDVNSDGRTNGISLPSLAAQEALLRRIYAQNHFDPDRLAFIEAHGTGTAAGDPIEATAIGRSIGRERDAALPIGSIKTNVGHLEPASGLAGIVKAMLALNHGVLPASLHFDVPNPAIDFEALNLTVCARPLPLPDAAEQYAGVSSFGFGGTNAHAIVAAGRKPAAHAASPDASEPGLFVVSANSSASLVTLARRYAERVPHLTDQETATLAGAIAHRRERQSHRIAVSSSRSADVSRALAAFVVGIDDPNLAAATSSGEEMPVAFVYSGNASQWAGMGVAAYRGNARFRARFDEVDDHFKPVGGWSLRDAMVSETLHERLQLASVAQPLIFAIQAATTAALRSGGIHPTTVIGHSVGEIAAAEAAGALDLPTAIKVIHYRSTHQEMTHGAGGMAAVFSSAEALQPIIDGISDLEIAAVNSPRTVTIAGSADALARFKRTAAERNIALLELDLEYPFHTALMTPIERKLRADLHDIAPREATVPFVSTVTGAAISGTRLDGAYWWRNVREPVQFMAAVRAAAQLGARYFVEIGARSMLLKHVTDSLRGEVGSFGTLAVLDRSDRDIDPFQKARARAVANGARVEIADIFGADPGPSVRLPHYPWQQSPFRFTPTVEAIGADPDRHPLVGARLNPDSKAWRASIDTVSHPLFADHRVGEQTIFPGTGFLEMAFEIGRQWLRSDSVIVTELEILTPLDLSSGETREVMTQLSPGSNTLEISSRPRLSQAGWLLHCRAKVHNGNANPKPGAPDLPPARKILDQSTLYRIADGSGLHYGPAFRQVERVSIHNDRLIGVHLARSNGEAGYLLDPLRIDCCGHGLFALFAALRAEERGVAYIPVRLEESTLYRPYVEPERAIIEVVRAGERSVVTNCYIYGPGDEIIAILRGVRGQAISTRRTGSLDNVAFVETARLLDGTVTGQVGVAATATDVMAAARVAGMTRDSGSEATDADVLIEGWATAAASEIVSGLAEHGIVDEESLIASGRIPESLRSWLITVMCNLEAAGLARRSGTGWAVDEDPSLPSATSVVKALAGEQQEHAGELLLAAALSGVARQVGQTHAITSNREAIVPQSALDFYHATSVFLKEGSATLYRLLGEQKRLWPKDRALRVLQVGFSPFAEKLLSEHRDAVQLTVFEPDSRRFESAELALSKRADVRLVDADRAHELGLFDLVVSIGGLHRLDSGIDGVAALLAPNGLFVAIEPRTSLFHDLVFGLDPAWFGAASRQHARSPLRPPSHWAAELEQAGLRNAAATIVDCGSCAVCLMTADARDLISIEGQASAIIAPVTAHAAGSILVAVPKHASTLAEKIAGSLSGLDASSSSIVAIDSELPDGMPRAVVLLPGGSIAPADPVEALTRRCLEIKSWAEKLAEGSAILWLVFEGASGSGAAQVRPVESGAWAFSRTLANEFTKLDIRRIDLEPGLPDAVAAKQIERIVASGTVETDLKVGRLAIQAVRITPLREALESGERSSQSPAVLHRRSASGQRLSWQPLERRRPGTDEVEIEVDAAGLNFRDLMWSLSLLPEDMLDSGFSGASLGLECAGRVSRAGVSVKAMQVGDRVLAFAGSSFATHVTVKASHAVKLPAGLSSEAAATIPVAFFTAHYALITLARLARREWVLIHGGAGAVGMAAVQIARAKGARAIVSAGSPAKRDLMRMLGADHVVDSRSTTFVDDVRRITGDGVDVVLNSLAGEAMERSIACLRPFGRFVELGKRDYVSNTHIGLRPFRRNLSYFGVDVDQVIGARRAFGERTFARIMREFESGKYVPLPYSVFDAGHVADAFHLMQQSSHIGKIVVRPQGAVVDSAATEAFRVRADGTHIVTGAFSGFGLATAKWLVEKGARHLVMISRSGPVSDEAQAALRAFAAQGVETIAEACDVTDRSGLERLFQTVHASMPPITGIMHAAMVLDDAMLANLDEERFRDVLAPKVCGAENLDYLVRGMSLDYFILFSSVTTLFGNPGQANYVAANAYMEGLARRRRQKGLPALAVAWGPISDVGVVARNERLQAGLQRTAGTAGLAAREALELMARAIGQSGESPVMVISPNNGAIASDRLVTLRSPTYAGFVSRNQKVGETAGTRVDLQALAASAGAEAVRRKVADVICAQLSHVLHLREDDINHVRPLGEIGLDSLMAVELVMNLEECFGIQIPLGSSSGAKSIVELADEIVAYVGIDRDEHALKANTVAEQHIASLDAGQRQALKEIVAGDALSAKRLSS